jgi:hypothetical protein
MRPSNSTPHYIPKKSETICPHKNLLTNVLSSIIHHYQKMKTNLSVQLMMKRYTKYGKVYTYYNMGRI